MKKKAMAERVASQFLAKREEIGQVAVDSGQLMILDPAYTKYLEPGSEHPEFTQEYLRGGTNQIHFQYGAPAAMNLRGWGGDGTFPVFQETNKDGLVTKVEIVFSKMAQRVATRFLATQ